MTYDDMLTFFNLLFCANAMLLLALRYALGHSPVGFAACVIVFVALFAMMAVWMYAEGGANAG